MVDHHSRRKSVIDQMAMMANFPTEDSEEGEDSYNGGGGGMEESLPVMVHVVDRNAAVAATGTGLNNIVEVDEGGETMGTTESSVHREERSNLELRSVVSVDSKIQRSEQQLLPRSSNLATLPPPSTTTIPEHGRRSPLLRGVGRTRSASARLSSMTSDGLVSDASFATMTTTTEFSDIEAPSPTTTTMYGDGGTTTTTTAIPIFGRMPILSTNRRHNMALPTIRPNAIPGGGEREAYLPNSNSSTIERDSNVTLTAPTSSSQPSGTTTATRRIQFAVGETALVLLTLLNVTNTQDPRDTFTVAPVNKLGFPQSEGRTDEEKAGPYLFVLATVNRVHFDEDDRYYTIVRADTGTEQRADSGWMEPLNDPAGIEAATRAAKLTLKSAQDKPIYTKEESGYLHGARDFFFDFVSWPTNFSRSTILPWYQPQRSNLKQTMTRLLHGDSPFACRVRITGVNFLVFCSTAFVFLEVIYLGFLPAKYDKQFSIVIAVVWSVLVLELMFEVIVRPRGYYKLIQSDRAFSPSTARHISRFHVIFETIALLTYVPEFMCIGSEICHRDRICSRVTSSVGFITGESQAISASSRFFLSLIILRLFGPIRHWKQNFINENFRPSKADGIEGSPILQDEDDYDFEKREKRASLLSKKNDDDANSTMGPVDENMRKLPSAEDDRHLKNAATIGTALMVVNSQRALLLLTTIAMVVPLLQTMVAQNIASYKMVDLLEAHNLVAPTNSTDDCAYLESAVNSWLQMAAAEQPASSLQKADHPYVLWAQLLPVRCDFQRDDGVITVCTGQSFDGAWETDLPEACEVWDDHQLLSVDDDLIFHFAAALDIRPDGIRRIDRSDPDGILSTFRTIVVYNENPTASLVNIGDFFVLLGILIVGLYGLNALRWEAIRLVLDPLQRMLKIVLRYAENPLSQDVKGGPNTKDGDKTMGVDLVEIGNYETEQLINAITKIADLLRKCWGVAGAGIISSNLARTKNGKTVVFNPTVPGKRVYALFGFVSINDFSEQLRALDRDVMILINDVAKVVHDEVYRWALGDHGQCNKNLGAAFLMVFRIGDFSEVQKKKQVATEKLFRESSKGSTKRAANLRNRHPTGLSIGRSPLINRKGTRADVEGQLQLTSLPGIQAFTDRALLGMLKSFAGVHRDKQLTTVWKNDFRLSAGVSAYHVDIIYGMDAGWAVEGAVGSEYKIDATYLSPHVNMASRMMSATRQYDVTILLSKAVEELLSRPCRKKLRHLDTVYVKGSKVKQEIFTYDARYHGADFFLFERTPEQADHDAEAYSPNIWEHDRDLMAMRQHVSDEFTEAYHAGLKQYLAGRWEEAYRHLERADGIMLETVLSDGYLEYEMEQLEERIRDRRDQSEDVVQIRNQIGDGACRTLMAYMERRQLIPPDDWDGVRGLASK